MRLELITRQPDAVMCKTPILFVHGAWHGAWCWDEHFLAYFAQQGFTAHALSLRNHGNSERLGQLRWIRGADFVSDVEQIVEQLGTAPVLVGHSYGGYIVQKYLEKHAVPAAILLAPVPPSGVFRATLRTLLRHPLSVVKTVLFLRLWPVVSTPRLAHEALFSKDMPDDQVKAYFARLQDESYLGYLDSMLFNLPHPRRVQRVPMLVLGAAKDAIFTPDEIQATARAYGAAAEIIPDIAHDVMLDAGWQTVADKAIAWLKSVPGVC